MKPTKSAVISAIIAICTGLLSWLVKNQYTAVLENHKALAILAYSGVFAVLVFVVSRLDKLLEWIWNRYIKYRFFWHRVWGEVFIEGTWVDVGIDNSGSQNRLMNYSSIQISRKDDKYTVEGVTWTLFGGDVHTWYSEHCELKGNTLTFWYASALGGSSHGKSIHDKAIYLFSSSLRLGRPSKFEGSYGDDHFRTVGRPTNELVAQIDSKELAKQNMHKYSSEENYDSNGIQAHSAPGALHDHQDWFRTFLRKSDKRKKEGALIQSLVPNIPNQISNILDIGPADGVLSKIVIGKLSENGRLQKRVSYFGVDPNGAHLDSTEKELVGIENLELNFLKQRIESFLSKKEFGPFEMMLALNVLYYVNPLELDKIFLRLSIGGYFVALHTDISSSQLLKSLAGISGGTLNVNVIGMIDEAIKVGTQQVKLEQISRESGTVTIDFPILSEEKWKILEGGVKRWADENIIDCEKLICFLTNKSVSEMQATAQWAKAVAIVRQHVLAHGNSVELPIIGQVLRRLS